MSRWQLDFDRGIAIGAAAADLHLCEQPELEATARTAVQCGLYPGDAELILHKAATDNHVDYAPADVRELERLIEQAREARDDERGRCEDPDGEARLVSYESAWPAGRSY